MRYLNTLQRILGHPLNHGRPREALRRFFSWQIGSRLVPGAVAVEFVNDAVLLIRPGMSGATQNVYCGLNDFEEMAFLLHLLRPEDLFIDVGANVGVYTVLASAVTGARTAAFEPNPATFAHLRKNVLVNGAEARVEMHQGALGREASTVHFSVEGPDAMHHVARSTDDLSKTIETSVARLDVVLAGAHPALVKMDVEGYEMEVLGGAPETLRDPALLAVIMESTEDARKYGFEASKPHETLLAQGFLRCNYEPKSRELLMLEREDAPGNIYVRNRALVAERLKGAPSFRIRGMTF